MSDRPLRLATRGSPLALWQADHVRQGLLRAHGLDAAAVEITPLTTSGDRIKDRPLREFGGKGLFTKEIDEALLEARADLAVHSMKDLPTELPEGLCIAAVLPRGDVRDAFISHKAATLAGLAPGAVVGTSSLRRQAQVRRARPDLRVIDLRGNVETRLNKIEQGVADATLLAMAGLERLGLAGHAAAILSPDEMLPAVAQGAIGVVCRTGDARTRNLVTALNDANSATAVACERAFLKQLDGSCKTPIAGLAEIDGEALRFRGLILRPDGTESFDVDIKGPVAEPEELGRRAGTDLLDRAGVDFLASFD